MRRHDLLRVEPTAWEAMLDVHPSLKRLPLVRDWASNGWPVMVRRRMEADIKGAVALALPLPPCHGKRRISFSLAADAGLSAISPVLLSDAAPVAPAAWAPVIAALQTLGDDIGSPPRVYGALLWEHVTSLEYLTETSDLDLLWRVRDEPTARLLLAGLTRLDGDSPVRLDGELELADGGGINWREWAQAEDCVLVKTVEGVIVRSIQDMFTAAP